MRCLPAGSSDGVMTGVASRVVRDVLSGEIPLILRRQVYATGSPCRAAGRVAARTYRVRHAWVRLQKRYAAASDRRRTPMFVITISMHIAEADAS